VAVVMNGPAGEWRVRHVASGVAPPNHAGGEQAFPQDAAPGMAIGLYSGQERSSRSGRNDPRIFRETDDDLLKILRHGGLGTLPFPKRLACGKFIGPPPSDGVVPSSAAQPASAIPMAASV
jgi:hypothetical protein